MNGFMLEAAEGMMFRCSLGRYGFGLSSASCVVPDHEKCLKSIPPIEVVWSFLILAYTSLFGQLGSPGCPLVVLDPCVCTIGYESVGMV